jgi:quinol monooxygenase YgiN
MYGLIAKLVSAPNRREDVIAILREGTTQMGGCFSYVIAKDLTDENTIWVTEVWDSAAAHDASLSLPAVKDAIVRAKPLIDAFSRIAVTDPVAGITPPLK